MKILIVEPRKLPRRADIPHTLEEMQKVVGGYIEIIYPFDDPVAVVCDDEGKLKGYELNRAFKGIDIIAGTFFIAGISEDDLTDLPDDLAEKYETMFRFPQMFFRSATGIVALSANGTVEVVS